MLRIGYDAQNLFNNFTGPGNYSRTLLANLAEYYPETAYFLYTPRVIRNEETHFFLNSPLYNVQLPRRGPRLFWRNFGVKKELQRHRIQLYHGLRHEVPVGLRHLFIKSLVTVHDLAFRRYPQQYGFVKRQMMDIRTRYGCEEADHIVAISEHTKREILEYYDIPPEKITVIYQSCHERYMQEKPNKTREAVRRRYQLPESYLLSVGSITERKNLLNVVKALETLPEGQRLPLIVVGKGGGYRRVVEQYLRRRRMEKWVRFLEVRFDDLPTLYQMADAFLYPSLYEGFGIPILEALFSQTPVLTSNTSSLPEAGGPGAHLVDPTSPEDIAAGLQQLLGDSAYRERLVRDGYAHAQQFRGQRVTEQMMHLYQQLIGEEDIVPEPIT